MILLFFSEVLENQLYLFPGKYKISWNLLKFSSKNKQK